MIKIILPKISQTTSVLYHAPEPRLVHATHPDSCMSPAMVPICWAPSCRGPDPLRSRRTAGTDYGAIFTISVDHRLVLVKQIKKRANQANTRHTVWAMALPWSSQHCNIARQGDHQCEVNGDRHKYLSLKKINHNFVMLSSLFWKPRHAAAASSSNLGRK